MSSQANTYLNKAARDFMNVGYALPKNSHEAAMRDGMINLTLALGFMYEEVIAKLEAIRLGSKQSARPPIR